MRRGKSQYRRAAAQQKRRPQLPQAIIHTKEKRPLLSIEVVEQTSDNLLQMLERKELDLMIGRFTEDRYRQLFDFRSLGPEPFVLVVNPRHPLAGASAIEPAELSRWPWILYPSGTPIRARIEQAFHDHHIALPDNTVDTISMPTFLQLLQSGPAVAMLPAPMVQPHLDTQALCRLDCDFSVAPLDFGIITRKDDPLPTAAAHFSDTLLMLSSTQPGRHDQ